MKAFDRIYYGGDYNPDQWDDATIEEDLRLFEQAGINLLTLPVFSWAKLEPKEGVYDFGWLDRVLDKIAQHGMKVCLATPTTAQPAWLSTQYPEVLPVDIAGRKRTHGMRVFFCYNSKKYRERAAALAEQMAKRYQRHPALAMWHISNEYGTYCYCPTCQAKFREWLKNRYGTVERLNEAWNLAFWGRIVYDFEEVTLPTELNDDYRFNPPIELDYMRFVTDSTSECFLNEYNVIKKYTPDIPVMTNMSGYIKKLDQSVLTQNLDIVGWDNYPAPGADPSFVAFKHEIMRGLKNGQSFMMTEQSPNQQNWQPYNKLKRPGEVRLLTYQAMAHGSDTCMFFQMHQSVGGQEKFHGSVIPLSGGERSRTYQECKALGQELKGLKDLFVGARIEARAGILFDWNSWWALELSSGPSKDMNYLESTAKYYKAFHDQNIPVDVLMHYADFSQYKIIVAPMLYMMRGDVAGRLNAFVKNGGILITTTMSGLVDENDRLIFGDYPGPLKDAMGIWVEETDALYPTEQNQMKRRPGAEDLLKNDSYACGFLCDVVHAEGAEVLAAFGSDFYQGCPCLTRHLFGEGMGYYIATEPGQEFLNDFLGAVCRENGILPLYPSSEGMELTCRVKGDTKVVFALNQSKKDGWVDFGGEKLKELFNGETVTGRVEVKALDVKLFQKMTE